MYFAFFIYLCQIKLKVITMATLYEIKIKTVSAFVNYDEKYVTEMFKKFLKKYRDPENNLGFEGTEIEVKRL